MSEAPGSDNERAWARLRLMLGRVGPGQLVILEVGPPRKRPALVESLRQEVAREFMYVNLGDMEDAERIVDHLRARIDAHGSADICVVDGFEDRARNREQSLALADELNLAREALGQLPVALVFLLPSFLVHRLRQRALNLWTWRAHHEVLSWSRIVVVSPLAPAPEPGAAEQAEHLKQVLDSATREGLSRRDLVHAAVIPYVRALYRATEYERALEVLDHISSDGALSELPREEAMLEASRGLCWGQLGQLERALGHLERALAGFRRSADEDGLLNTLCHLGYAATVIGELERAESWLLEALQRAESRYRDRFSVIVNIRLLLAEVYIHAGRLYEAYALVDATHEQYQSLPPNTEINKLWLVNKLGDVYSALGDHHQAIARCHEALELARRSPDRGVDIGVLQANLARNYHDVGDDERARHWCREALATYEGRGDDEHQVAHKMRALLTELEGEGANPLSPAGRSGRPGDTGPGPGPGAGA